MAVGLGLTGRQGMQSTKDTLSGNGRMVAQTDAAGKSIERSKAALDIQKKVQAMQTTTQKAG